MINVGKFRAKREHKEATNELARLNREMALQMIQLAAKTGEKRPLIEAVKSLRAAGELYAFETTPIENAEIQLRLGDVLLKLASNEGDDEALEHAILAYRGAITIASLLGAENLRSKARINYKKALKIAGKDGGKRKPPLMGAA